MYLLCGGGERHFSRASARFGDGIRTHSGLHVLYEN